MADPSAPAEGYAVVTKRMEQLEKRLKRLESPSGTQRYGSVDRVQATLDYLASLQTHASSGAPAVITGTVANDAVTHWFASSPDTRVANLEIPTGRALVTASVGEASLQAGGSYVLGYVSYSVRDVNGDVVPGAAIGNNSGRLYTSQRMGLSITTGQQLVVVDPDLNPGPYTVRAFVGLWVAAANTTPCSGTFNDLALTVQIIGSGVDI